MHSSKCLWEALWLTDCFCLGICEWLFYKCVWIFEINIALVCEFNAHDFDVSVCQHLLTAASKLLSLMDAPPAFLPRPCPSSPYMHAHRSQKSLPRACHHDSIMSVFAWGYTASLLCFFLSLKRCDPTMQCSFGSWNQHNKGPNLVISGVEMFPKPLSVLSAMSACGGIRVCGSRLSLLVHVGNVFYLSGIVMVTGNVHVPRCCWYLVTGTCWRVPAGEERLSVETFQKKR